MDSQVSLMMISTGLHLSWQFVGWADGEWNAFIATVTVYARFKT